MLTVENLKKTEKHKRKKIRIIHYPTFQKQPLLTSWHITFPGTFFNRVELMLDMEFCILFFIMWHNINKQCLISYAFIMSRLL